MIEFIIPYLGSYGSWFATNVANNQFLIGMVTTAILTMGAYISRTLPKTIGRSIYHLITTEVTFNSDDANFDVFAEFVLKKVIIRSFQRSYNLQFDRDGNETLSPGYGTHWGWVLYRPCRVSRTMIEGSATEKFKEQITLTVLGRKERLLERVLGEMRAFILSKRVTCTDIVTYVNGGSNWSWMGEKPRRDPASIVLKQGQWDSMTGVIDKFLSSEKLYLERGIPYHLGIFLDGKPGCGKSSLIHVLASHYKRNIRFLDLNSITEEGEVYDLMGQNWRDTFLVIEDIDATRAQTSRDGDDEGRHTINLSTILNVLDGLASPHGLIVIATSNHKERLDPALIRKGRFDYHVEIGYLDWNMWVRMCEKFDRHSPVTENQFVSCPPVDASFHLAYSTSDEIASYFQERKQNA